MGLSERDPDEPVRAVDRSPAGRRPPRDGHWAGRPAPGSNGPQYDAPHPARPARPACGDPARTDPARTDPVALLGRLVDHDDVRLAFRAWELHPSSGAPDDSGPSRSYRARAAGLEVAADAHGVVTAVFLHFHGDDGFGTYQGAIPGAGGVAPRRASLRSRLGEPAACGEPYRDRFLGDFGPWDRWELPGCVLHAQYAHDGERLHRVTLTAAAD